MEYSLDIETEKGQVTLMQEKQAYSIFEGRFPEFSVLHTDKTKPEPFDGWIIRDGKITSIVETKCRVDVSYGEFLQRYRNIWLVTEAKLQMISSYIQESSSPVPLYGFLFFPNSKVLLIKRIIDRNGEITKRELRKTNTQATVNGGIAYRLNAFIPMKDAMILKGI